jgi:hypothetical protein
MVAGGEHARAVSTISSLQCQPAPVNRLDRSTQSVAIANIFVVQNDSWIDVPRDGSPWFAPLERVKTRCLASSL